MIANNDDQLKRPSRMWLILSPPSIYPPPSTQVESNAHKLEGSLELQYHARPLGSLLSLMCWLDLLQLIRLSASLGTGAVESHAAAAAAGSFLRGCTHTNSGCTHTDRHTDRLPSYFLLAKISSGWSGWHPKFISHFPSFCQSADKIC